MSSEDQYLSKERYDELQKELEFLRIDKRKEVADHLKRAKEFGDLSENSEYAEAKEAQQKLEMRIAEVSDLLKSAKIITKRGKGGAVRVGSTVTVKRGTKSMQFTIVGSNETDPSQSKISNESPMGEALLGKKQGEKVRVEAPAGGQFYEIVSVE